MTEADYLDQGYPRKVAAFMAAHPPPPLEVWPDNWLPFQVFSVLWCSSMNGVTGVDYNILFKKRFLRIYDIRKKQLAQLFADLHVMENAALNKIHKDG